MTNSTTKNASDARRDLLIELLERADAPVLVSPFKEGMTQEEVAKILFDLQAEVRHEAGTLWND